MTEPSKEARKRRSVLTEATWQPGEPWHVAIARAFSLYIDEVDRVAREALERLEDKRGISRSVYAAEAIRSLILPDPPDPLAEILELTQVYYSSEENAKAFRAELAKRGLEVRKSGLRLRKHFSWSGTLS